MIVTIGVSMNGSREVLATAVGDSESFEFWREFFASLTARGLSGVQLVITCVGGETTEGVEAGFASPPSALRFNRCGGG